MNVVLFDASSPTRRSGKGGTRRFGKYIHHVLHAFALARRKLNSAVLVPAQTAKPRVCLNPGPFIIHQPALSNARVTGMQWRRCRQRQARLSRVETSAVQSCQPLLH